MPAHIKKRGKYYQLIDGRNVRISLKTDKRGVAEYLLKQHILGKHGITQGTGPTVKEYYEKWIEQKESEWRNGLIRKSLLKSYKHHWTCYILSELGQKDITALTANHLLSLRSHLLTNVISIKTCRNVFSSFQAYWRSARKEGLVKENPFELMEWPRVKRMRISPFGREESSSIQQQFEEHEPHYYPFVFTMFHTGMRPSEAIALKWEDINFEQGTITIEKSRHLKETGETKTANSHRVITVDKPVREHLGRLQILSSQCGSVFTNKYGTPLDAGRWASYYWRRTLAILEIPYRKFYCTRHTFITEAIKRGENPVAVAQYVGDEVSTIMKHYCGRLELNGTGSTKEPQAPEKPIENIAQAMGR